MDNHKPTEANEGAAEPAPAEILQLPPQLEDAKQALIRLNDRTLAFARGRPLTCIADALAPRRHLQFRPG